MDGCALVSTNAGWNLAIGAFPRATGRFETLKSSDGCREVTGQVQQDRCWLDYGIANIAPLATLPYLGWVTLYDNTLHDISALVGLTNLTYLDLRVNLLGSFTLFLLIIAPYVDSNPSNKPDDRKFAISIFTIFLMFWAVLVIIGP